MIGQVQRPRERRHHVALPIRESTPKEGKEKDTAIRSLATNHTLVFGVLEHTAICTHKFVIPCRTTETPCLHEYACLLRASHCP